MLVGAFAITAQMALAADKWTALDKSVWCDESGSGAGVSFSQEEDGHLWAQIVEGHNGTVTASWKGPLTLDADGAMKGTLDRWNGDEQLTTRFRLSADQKQIMEDSPSRTFRRWKNMRIECGAPGSTIE